MGVRSRVLKENKIKEKMKIWGYQINLDSQRWRGQGEITVAENQRARTSGIAQWNYELVLQDKEKWLKVFRKHSGMMKPADLKDHWWYVENK